MIFNVITAHADKAEVLVSGSLNGTTEDEKELLNIIQDEFNKIKTYNDRVSAKNNKLVFKSVPMRLLKQTLSYLAGALEFELTYKVDSNFKGDAKIKSLVEKSF
ncbi:MAG: hypothetical protein IKP66_01570 [Lachnospiraceae bacterium]|nr:hypothetical protein [Lachnospiraceae bacterium]